MTLNGILQGYAADLVIAAARRHGVADAFVDTGEFGAFGRHPDGARGGSAAARPRRAARPTFCRAIFKVSPRRRRAPARRFRRTAPTTTSSTPHRPLAATSLARRRLRAERDRGDGLSTAIYVMGKARGEALLAGRPGYALDLM
ncbi:FAD:protein FMN transferase [Chenggangzhangella methanolivorans]|uniref:FAD:protein FMN transferase n=1 Tax=Chenggangzhangella methanolivorans TaxID=1437009 RepID=UPI003D16E38F